MPESNGVGGHGGKKEPEKRPVHAVCTLLVMYLTSTFGTLFMLFPYIPLLFVDRRLFHVLSDFSLKIWFGLSVFLLEKLCRIKIVLHRAKTNRNERFAKSSIVLMNHRTRLDWMFYFCILFRLGAMSNIKIILKDGLKKIPGPSWAMQTALFIFIKRRWESDKLTFTKFIDYYNVIKKRVHILIFPEGTNLTPETIEKSNQFADANSLKRYEQVLHPRTTGFIHVYNEMTRNQMIDCVQDVTVAYRGGQIPENEPKFMKGHLPDEIHFFIESFSCEQIAAHSSSGGDQSNTKIAADKNLENWLVDRWAKKESFLQSFYAQTSPPSAGDGPSSTSSSSFESVYASKFDLVVKSDKENLILFVYPIYWLASTILMIYLIYSYFLVKLFFVVSFLFYFLVQVKGNGLDNLIMNLPLASTKKLD